MGYLMNILDIPRISKNYNCDKKWNISNPCLQFLRFKHQQTFRLLAERNISSANWWEKLQAQTMSRTLEARSFWAARHIKITKIIGFALMWNAFFGTLFGYLFCGWMIWHTLTACLQHGNISWQGYLCSCRHLPLETLKNSDSLWLVPWAPMIKAATGLGGTVLEAGWNEVELMI